MLFAPIATKVAYRQHAYLGSMRTRAACLRRADPLLDTNEAVGRARSGARGNYGLPEPRDSASMTRGFAVVNDPAEAIEHKDQLGAE
jgi:hypothetical protein